MCATRDKRYSSGWTRRCGYNGEPSCVQEKPAATLFSDSCCGVFDAWAELHRQSDVVSPRGASTKKVPGEWKAGRMPVSSRKPFFPGKAGRAKVWFPNLAVHGHMYLPFCPLVLDIGVIHQKPDTGRHCIPNHCLRPFSRNPDRPGRSNVRVREFLHHRWG